MTSYGYDGVSNHEGHHYLLNHIFNRRSNETSRQRVTGLSVVNSPVTSEFPAHMASNAENVSIWWRHHVLQPSPFTPEHLPCVFNQFLWIPHHWIYTCKIYPYRNIWYLDGQIKHVGKFSIISRYSWRGTTFYICLAFIHVFVHYPCFG